MSKKRERVSIARVNWLMLFRETITVYFENNMKPIHSELLNVEAGDAYIPRDHRALKV
jgi:hypothetical protein